MKIKNIFKNTLFAIVVVLISYGIVNAGNLSPTSPNIVPTFKTLGDIYNKLIDNTTTTVDHTLASSDAPTSTFYTLDQIYNKIPTLDAGNILDTASYMGVTGTIPTRTIASTTSTIYTGYYLATDLATIDTDLSSGNILSGINIFGVSGSMHPSELLKTGQTTTYVSGDDGDYEKGHVRSYIITTTTVLDTSTGLMWKKCSQGLTGNMCESGALSPDNWGGAINACNNLDFDGYTDWRLPNISELLSIVDYSKIDLTIDTNVFPATKNEHYWSSTTLMSTTGYAWSVAFWAAYSDYNPKSSSYQIRCVRSAS